MANFHVFKNIFIPGTKFINKLYLLKQGKWYINPHLSFVNSVGCQISSEKYTFEDDMRLKKNLNMFKKKKGKLEEINVDLTKDKRLNSTLLELDAFSCPSIKCENFKLKDELDKVRNENAELQHQLCDKELYYTQREEELQALHRCELEKAKETMLDMEKLITSRVKKLEEDLAEKEKQQKHELECLRVDMEEKLLAKEQALIETEERLKMLSMSESELKSQLCTMEQQQLEQLDCHVKRENKYNERIKVLNKELEKLRENKQHRERELREKLDLSHDEITLLRNTPRKNDDRPQPMRHSSASCASNSNANSHLELARLQSEAESLRCVLELKQSEISKLNKQNEELLRDAEERANLRAKISSLESHKEMLQSELDIKTEKEKEYLRQLDEIQKKLKHEGQKRTRLSYDNEALSWQLKQRSEQLHILQNKLHESLRERSSSLSNGSLGQTLTTMSETGSPPTSPMIKGVIEKNYSVSWVLEMDDETPESAACKIVRRVGSFRSCDRNSAQRRQLSISADSGVQSKSSGPNPLCQSMSAASVIRQHSSEQTNSQTKPTARLRSHSVSTKCSSGDEQEIKQHGKKLSRQHSIGANHKMDVPITWKEPLSASSPYSAIRPHTSALKSGEGCQKELCFRAAECTGGGSGTTRKLITCDTSTLNTGERLEICAGLKTRKKCYELRESAGEAMVSGTNSEDEGCSASSDDIGSSDCTSSATSTSSCSLHQMKNSNMSLEEVLLLEKINSLNATPMECSWSDDAENYPQV